MKTSDFIKYLQGQGDADWNAVFEEWLSESDENLQRFEDFKSAWNISDKYHENFNPDVDSAWNNFMLNNRKQGKTAPDPGRSLRYTGAGNRRLIRRRYLTGIAATIAILAGIGWIIISSTGTIGNGRLAKTWSSGDSIIKIVLPDNSTVWLNRNSTLSLNGKFGSDRRNVKLAGEGFFEVSRDPDHPFTVSFQKSEVRVLGTSFNIKSTTHREQVSVTVRTGRVAFYTKNGRKKKAELVAGDRIVYDPSDDQMLHSQISGDNYLAWKTGVFRFTDTPLEEVFSVLEAYFDTRFTSYLEFRDDVTLSGNFPVDSLPEILEAIELTFDFKITKDSSDHFLIRDPLHTGNPN